MSKKSIYNAVGLSARFSLKKHERAGRKAAGVRNICASTCLAGAPPAFAYCAPAVKPHEVNRLILADCSYTFPTLETTTPAAMCTALQAAATAGQVFVTPPLVAEIGAPSFTNLKLSCHMSLPIEGARKLTFESAASWTVTAGAGATAPVYGDNNYWQTVSQNPLWVVRGYVACDGNIYLLQKNGTFVDVRISVWQEVKAVGDTNIMITKGEFEMPLGWDNFGQPQINVNTCGGSLSTWGS